MAQRQFTNYYDILGVTINYGTKTIYYDIKIWYKYIFFSILYGVTIDYGTKTIYNDVHRATIDYVTETNSLQWHSWSMMYYDKNTIYYDMLRVTIDYDTQTIDYNQSV